jgi:1-acyl-sn-glycerol-3-phosphate acyltransferase
VRTPVLDVFRPLVRGLSRVYFGLELRGTERIPARGPLIVAPNHQTFADPVLVTIPIRRRVYFMAWRRLFQIPLLGRAIRVLRAFPVDLDARDPQAVREARRRLVEDDAVVMIFPEGGRTKDGTLGHFHMGAFRLAASLRVPILPVTITGAHECWPPGRRLPRRGRITITYHPLLTIDGPADPRAAAHDLAERTRAAIASALGPTCSGPPRDSRRLPGGA